MSNLEYWQYVEPAEEEDPDAMFAELKKKKKKKSKSIEEVMPQIYTYIYFSLNIFFRMLLPKQKA